MNNSEGTMGSNLILVRYLIKWLLSVVNSYSADVIFAFDISTYCCNAQYELGEYSERMLHQQLSQIIIALHD